MQTGRPFTSRASVPLLAAAASSIGAHLAAKLKEFRSDERTLTDELCDMLCIWSQQFGTQPAPANQGMTSPLTHAMAQFDLSLRKSTASEEAEIGADLELTLRTPLGSKTALIQAKVFDAGKDSLRYDSRRDFEKLRKQLASARKRAGDLAMLLLYLPADLLNRETHGFATWEQGFAQSAPATTTSSRFGVTLIPASLLLNARNSWRSKGRLTHLGEGRFSPPGVSFERFMLEMLCCRRGTWHGNGVGSLVLSSAVQADGVVAELPPFRRLDVDIGRPQDLSFDSLAETVRQELDRAADGAG